MRGIAALTNSIEESAEEFKRGFTHPAFVCCLLVTGLATVAMMPIFGHGLPPISDAFEHYRWASGFIEALGEGTLYPRWLPNPNYGAGSPAMNYYPPLPFYVVAAFYLITGSTLKSLALGCWLALALSGATMYIYARSLLSHRAGLLAAALYILAPYHLMDLYQRVALSEFWAFVWVPLVFYAVRRVAAGRGWRAVPLLAVSYASLLFTHVLSAFAVTLILPIYVIIITRNVRRIAKTVAGLALGVGLAAIFVMPLVLEKGYVRLHRIHAKKYLKHFLIENLPAASKADPFPTSQRAEFIFQQPDYFFFEASAVLSILMLALTTVLIWKWRAEDRCDNSERRPLRAIWVVTLFSLFMTTRLSSPVWSIVPGLPYMQFPFRWLVIASAGIAFLSAAAWPLVIKQRRSRVIYGIAIISLLALNLVVSTFVIVRQQRGEQAIPQKASDLEVPEYRPRGWGYKNIQDRSPAAVSVASGVAVVQPVDERGAKQSYAVNAGTEAMLKFRTLYFPGWVGRMDGNPVELGRSEEGNIELLVAPGEHRLTLSFEDTWPRTAGKITSLVCFLGILAALYWIRRRGNDTAAMRP